MCNHTKSSPDVMLLINSLLTSTWGFYYDWFYPCKNMLDGCDVF